MPARIAHDVVLEALRQRIAGRQALIEAVDASNAAETPEDYRRALTRVVDVIKTNDRTHAIWRRQREIQGKLKKR